MGTFENDPGRSVISRTSRMGAVALAAITVLMSSGCGASADSTGDEPIGAEEQEIINGRASTDALGYSLVTVAVYHQHENENYNDSCTGTIISQRHILTARHCSVAPGDTVFYYKDQNLQSKQFSKVLQVYYEPLQGGWEDVDAFWGGPNKSLQDWMVLYLDKPFPVQAPGARMVAKLPFQPMYPGQVAVGVGRGLHDGRGPVDEMRYANATIQSVDSGDDFGLITSTYYDNEGDSGGPLLTPDTTSFMSQEWSGFTVNSTLLGNNVTDGVTRTWSTSVYDQFDKIMASTGLSVRQGYWINTDRGMDTTASNYKECAGFCRGLNWCTVYDYDGDSRACSLRYGTYLGSRRASRNTVYGMKNDTGHCGDPNVKCTFPNSYAYEEMAPLFVPPMDYLYCGDDFQSCVFSGPKYVAYGMNNSFVYKAVTGAGLHNISCSPDTFGVDPLPGVSKRCWIASYGLQTSEGGSATSLAGGEVAYGADGRFLFKNISGAYTCNTTTFGGDPRYGVVKSCYRALPEYTRLKAEGETFATAIGTSVAYGANGKYFFKLLGGSNVCNSDTFGGDPIYGVAKSCYAFVHKKLGDEGQMITATGAHTVFFGSGLNGRYTSASITGSFTCGAAAFGNQFLAPDRFASGHCWGD